MTLTGLDTPDAGGCLQIEAVSPSHRCSLQNYSFRIAAALNHQKCDPPRACCANAATPSIGPRAAQQLLGLPE